MIRPSLLASAQDAVASAFLGEGIQVMWDAQVPHADLKNRVIHLRPLPETISEEEMIDIRADCDHELAHFLYSDPYALEDLDDEVVALLANAIEDGVVERLHGSRYLGAKENMERSNLRLIDELKQSASEDNKQFRLTTATTLLSYGRSIESVIELLGADLSHGLQEIEKLVPLLREAKTTQDSVRLAKRIAGVWKLRKEEGCDQNTVPAETDQRAPGPRYMAGRPKTISDVRKAKIGSFDFNQEDYYHVDTSRDTENVIPSAQALQFPDVHQFFMEQVRSEAAAMRRRLTMSLKSVGDVEGRAQKRGRLDDRLLHKVALGDISVFKSPSRALVHNIDITLMVDSSGSMVKVGRLPRGANLLSHRMKTKLWIAAQSAAACSLVLDIVGITHEVLAWTTHPEKIDGLSNRTTPLRHMIVKSAKQDFRSSQHRFSDLALFDCPADNIDGESILWGARRLARRARRSNKSPIMIVFSDGEPLAVAEDQSELRAHLKESVERITRAGIRVIGIGLQTDCVADFYPAWGRIDDLTQLTPTLYDILRREIKRFQKD